MTTDKATIDSRLEYEIGFACDLLAMAIQRKEFNKAIRIKEKLAVTVKSLLLEVVREAVGELEDDIPMEDRVGSFDSWIELNKEIRSRNKFKKEILEKVRGL
jgi:hypothetical protein